MIEVYSGEPTVEITLPDAYTITAVAVSQLDAAPVTPVYTVSAPFGSPAKKTVTVDVIEQTSWPAEFSIRIDLLVGSTPRFAKYDYRPVVPYVSVEDIASAGGLSLTDSDSPSYRSYSDVKEMETLARHIVEAYTGKFFGKEYGVRRGEGTDSASLYSGSPIVWIDSVTHDDDVLFSWSDSIGSSEISPTGHTVEIKDESGERYGFPENSKYEIAGIFGMNSVPTDVDMATKMLAVHFLCSDSAAHNSYIEQIKFGESANKYNRLAFAGTGLLAADTLLQKYRFHNYKVL
jgi:hypothetical protein